MCRGLLSVLSAVCFSGLLPAAAPVQSAGGDRLVRAKDGDFTLRLPAAWRTEVNPGGVDAFGDGISMLLSASTQQGGIAYSGAYTMRNWKGVSSEDDTAIIGDSPKPAPIRVFHGAGNDGIRAVRRVVVFHGVRADAGPAHPASSPVPQPAAATRPAPAPAGAAAASQLEPYVAPNRLYALYKPADWKVTEVTGDGTFAITVTSPDRAQVNLTWMRASRPNLLRFMATCRGGLAQTYPGASYSDIRVSRDGTRGVATLTYPLGNLRAQGRVYFEATATGATMQEYAAPEKQLAALRPVLLNVMASVSFIKPPRDASGKAGAAAPVRVTLVARHAPDGSLSLSMPEDWSFQAGRGHVIAGKPGGGLGFIFTAFSGNPMRIMAKATIAQGVIASPYRRPSQTLPLILQGFGHRNITVLSTAEDRATVGQCASFGRGGCEAEDMLAQWTSKDGMDCVGGFKVVNNRPGAMGQWSSVVAGIWGPRKEIGRYVPMLVEVGNSFSINGQYARNYIAAGLENLQRLKAETAARMADLRYAREDMQRAWEQREARKDYMDSKWDDYRRGNSYWVSDLEGGKVYKTDTWGTRDTRTGDYYEGGGYTWTYFEGQNPRYPSEDMREISSYELEHGGPPPR